MGTALSSQSLPGGVFVNGRRGQTFNFKSINGELELALQECMSAREDSFYPQKARQILELALDSVDGQVADPALVDNLSLGDRDFLLIKLAQHISDKPVWVTAECEQCSDLMDISFRFSELPVKPAGEKYPSVDVATSFGKVTVRVPLVSDLEVIAKVDDDNLAFEKLLTRLVSMTEKNTQIDLEKFSENDVALIEIMIEKMSPEVSAQLYAVCPNCDHANHVNLDILELMAENDNNILHEVHCIAESYHWSQAEILGLPRQRRKNYLYLIDRQRGYHTEDNTDGVH